MKMTRKKIKGKMIKAFKDVKGITLIALIITVIIMLILAGVSISVLTNGDRLFEKTQLAVDTYNQAVQNEAEQITSLMNDIDIYLNGLQHSYPNGAWTGTVNEPKVDGTGLIPVKFDTNGVPTELTPEQAKSTTWYNYVDTSVAGNENKSEWANAVTKNEHGEITGYFVWIPRYEYKITYTNNSDKSQGGIIDINFIPTDTITPTTGYTIHPAFTDESTISPVYKNGGWNKEIPGFWVAKFEAGYAGKEKNDSNNDVTVTDSGLTYTGDYNTIVNYYGAITSDTTTMKLPVFLPKTYAYNFINIGDAFNLSRKVQDASAYYGLNNIKTNSHMMKNSEWGAVAYLANSKYGRNGTEIAINNVTMNNEVDTIYGITGYAGEEIDARKNTLTESILSDELPDELTGNLTSYSWNTSYGKLASSTGNISGVYGLNGGAWEYTAVYLNVSNNKYINSNGGTFTKSDIDNTITTSTEYASVYEISGDGSSRTLNYNANEGRKGEAIWETSISGENNTSWNTDASFFSTPMNPFLMRSGYYNQGINAGSFYFSYSSGNAHKEHSFRIVLFPNTDV